MIYQMLTCPHCAAGFSSHDELHTHGRDAHRDLSPKEHDQTDCPYCAAEYEERTMRDEHVEENRKVATDRLKD